MEAMLGETGEGSREEAGSSSCDTGGTCFNGELNGDLEENMERCNVSQHNSIMLKVVSNKCLNEERSSITDSSPQVTSNSGSAEHRQEIFSEKSETSDKVPNSEPANMCRDLASEVPTSVGKSVEHIDIGKSVDIQDNIPVSTHSIKDSELSKEILNVNKNCDESNSHSSVHEDNAVLNDVMHAAEKSVVELSDNSEMKSSDEKYVTDTAEKNVVFENSADCSTEKNCVVNVEEISIKKLDSAENEIGSFDGEEEEHNKLEKTNGKEDSGDESAKDDDLIKLKPVAHDDTYEPENEVKTQSQVSIGDAASSECPEQNNDNTKNSDQYQVLSSVPEEKNEHSQNTSENPETKSEEVSAKAKKSRKSATVLNLTPRRSSRNLNKQKSYVEKEDEPEIQEITPGDPLADPLSTDPLRDDKENSKTRGARKNTIVVNDTKRLVEIATGSKGMKGGKKEPTLVIIDTNSILSGRGPVPVSQGSPPGPSSVSTSTSGYSVLPIALPAQGFYPPIRLNSPLPPNPVHPPTPAPVQPRPSPPQILPTLTDDMYVVEAPSFIVPYVYEKPPIKPLKEYLEQLEIEIEETKSNKETGNEDEKVAPDCSQENGCSENEQVKNQEDEEQCKENGEESEAQTPSTRLEDENQSSDKDVDANENISDSENVSKANTITTETKEESSEKETSIADGEKGAETRTSENNGNNTSVEGREKNEIKLDETSKSTYFDNPLGKFFMQIGINLVQEYVQTDLLRSQKRKRDREGRKGTVSTQFAINSLVKNLEFSKENNEPFHLEQKKCEYCSFKTESSLVMAQHLETPHMRNYVYRCNFCPLEVRSPHDILFHMEAEHNVRGRLERAPAFHQCPNCPFEDSQKGKLTRHMLSCAKKHKPERNQEPPPDWEPPAKIPRLARSRPTALGLGAAAYQAMAAKSVHPLLPKLVPGTVLPPSTGSLNRGRGRPPIHGRYIPDPKTAQRPIAPTQIRQNMMYRPGASTGQQQVLLPTAYQIAGSQIYQVVGSQNQMMPLVSSSVPSEPRLALMSPSTVNTSVPTPVALVSNIATGNSSITIQSQSKSPTAKLLQQPSISITPLPRQPAGMAPGSTMHPKHVGHSGHPGHSPNKATFVICEICDGYIKDLEQLRNHMQWIHKVKIHPKMIYNRPPLNCQKCQFRFFTDQGLERHLLGSHGLVTSSMQEAANKGKDGGRCPVCGRVYQWKLLNHVARDHNMSLKPAHLSYKCTVCTATFGMYKQFENHVYSAHSVVAKRVIDKKSPQVPRPQSSETLLKPLKINDEITIIPQPARPRPGPASRTGAVSAIMQQNMGPKRFKQRLQQKQSSVQVIELEDSPVKKDKATDGSGFQENGEDTLNAVKERLRRRKSLEISQVDSECSSHLSDDTPAKKRRRNDE